MRMPDIPQRGRSRGQILEHLREQVNVREPVVCLECDRNPELICCDGGLVEDITCLPDRLVAAATSAPLSAEYPHHRRFPFARQLEHRHQLIERTARLRCGGSPG